MRRSISCRASTAVDAASSGSTSCATARSNCVRTSAEKRARFTTSRTLARLHTSMTCKCWSGVDTTTGFKHIGQATEVPALLPSARHGCHASMMRGSRKLGCAASGTHLKGDVFAFPVAVKPQHKPLRVPRLLLQVALCCLLVLQHTSKHHQRVCRPGCGLIEAQGLWLLPRLGNKLLHWRSVQLHGAAAVPLFVLRQEVQL